MRAIKSDPGTAAIANNASGSPINSPTWVSDMCNSSCTCGITGGMARMVMRIATPASQSTNMSLMRRPTGRPSRLAAEVMERKPGVGAATCLSGRDGARNGAASLFCACEGDVTLGNPKYKG